MAKNQSERIAVIETEVKNLNKKLDKHIDDQDIAFKRLHDKIDIFIGAIDVQLNLKASKVRVEELGQELRAVNKTMYIWTGAIAVIVFVITMVIHNLS